MQSCGLDKVKHSLIGKATLFLQGKKIPTEVSIFKNDWFCA